MASASKVESDGEHHWPRGTIGEQTGCGHHPGAHNELQCTHRRRGFRASHSRLQESLAETEMDTTLFEIAEADSDATASKEGTMPM